jgi:CHAT domain-containing protein/tetratricopeptide (TPR) repeat protein
MLALLAAAAFLLAPPDEPARLVPGQRLEGVERARFEVAQAGAYTLARSDGALVLGERRGETGWLVAELPAGVHEVVLPEGPGDVTAFAGAVEEASCGAFLNRAIAQLNAGDLSAARTSLLACRARPGQAANHALARMFTGSLLQREGQDLDQARELLTGSLGAVSAFGPDIIAYAEKSLGDIALARQEWDEAQQRFERVREVTTDAGIRALALSGLARAAAGRRDQETARNLHAQALAAVEGGEASYVASVAFEAGKWHQSRAEFARAAELLERAAAFAPSWFDQVAAVGQLGLVEMRRGRYGVALGHMDRAQALAEPHAPSRHDAKLAQNRSELAFCLGELGVAEEVNERLLDTLEDAGSRATVASNLALLADLREERQRADRLAEQALALAPAGSRARWLALDGRAGVLLARDKSAQAAPLCDEALALARELDDPYLVSVSLMKAGEASLRRGDAGAARAQAEAALAGFEQQGAHEMLLPALHGVGQAALEQGDEATVEALLERAWRESARPELSGLPEGGLAFARARVSRRDDWGHLAADYAARRAARDPRLAAAGLREVSRWKTRTLVDALAAVPDRTSDVDPGLVAALAGRTLVEYAPGDRRLHAFVVDGAAVRMVDLGELRPIEDRVQEYLDGLDDPGALADAATVARLGSRLHARLLAPLGLEREAVVIIPGGDLARLPFEALVVTAPDGARRFDQLEFVLDRMDVGYAPSSVALAALASRPAPDGNRRALLLGDPTYVEEVRPGLLASRGAAARSWVRLAYSRDELTRVARLLLAARDDQGARDDLMRLVQLDGVRDVALSTSTFDLRLGREASAESLRQLAPEAGLIHIAAHADVDPWDPRRTGLVLSWDEVGQGLFSLADIASLSLRAELVVLSACNTAGGRLLHGEGVQSMAGAFLAAGARGVVATLWPVQDAQAQDLMEAFADARLDVGEPSDRALRLAKRKLRTGVGVRGASADPERPDRGLGHPHYWAAFLFSGAPDAATR